MDAKLDFTTLIFSSTWGIYFTSLIFLFFVEIL